MSQEENQKTLKSYIKHVISEKLLRIDNKEYYVTPSQLSKIKSFLAAEESAEGSELRAVSSSFTIEDAYKDFLSRLNVTLPSLATKIDYSVQTAYPGEDTKKLIKRLLVDSDILSSEGPIGLFLSPPAPGSTVAVPKDVLNIAEFSYAEKAGAMRGKGEFVIPLLFDNSKMSGGNDLIDVVIAGKEWHVKARTSADGLKGARMGSASSVVFTSTNVYKNLVKAGVDASIFAEMGMQKFRDNLQGFAAALKMSEEDAYETMRTDAVNAAMVPGRNVQGICFYEDGAFDFVGKNDLYFYGTTQQGRIILSKSPQVKQKILGSLRLGRAPAPVQ